MFIDYTITLHSLMHVAAMIMAQPDSTTDSTHLRFETTVRADGRNVLPLNFRSSTTNEWVWFGTLISTTEQ